MDAAAGFIFIDGVYFFVCILTSKLSTYANTIDWIVWWHREYTVACKGIQCLKETITKPTNQQHQNNQSKPEEAKQTKAPKTKTHQKNPHKNKQKKLKTKTRRASLLRINEYSKDSFDLTFIEWCWMLLSVQFCLMGCY